MPDIYYVETYHIDESAPSNKKILIYTGVCFLFRVLLKTDTLNDPTFSIYDGIDNTGDIIVPSVEYEADYKDLRGYTAESPDKCDTGLVVYVTCAGDVEIVVKYRTAVSMPWLPM